jgi:hypothetical protein
MEIKKFCKIKNREIIKENKEEGSKYEKKKRIHTDTKTKRERNKEERLELKKGTK